jgi:UDP-N-acetylmuramyl pentapeptide phosphotransferase/UDP-N-acetylglucosamine-1-phosphate transferase
MVLVVAAASAVAVRLARALALRKALLDIPNERSSHRQPVPRLGGAAFMPVVLLAIGLLAPREPGLAGVVPALLGGAFVLYAVSLADDLLTLPAVLRLAVQAAAALAVLFFLRGQWPALSAARTGSLAVLLDASSPGFWLLAIWIVGLANIYNFMDGIDGIAGIQAVAAGGFWLALGLHLPAPVLATVGACVVAGALGFLSLNWPPAKIFMGDAGSTVLGYLFAAAPLVAMVEIKVRVRPDALLFAGALAVWPFLLDGVFTILRRLRRGENILEAHRSHLYQRLVIAGWSHRRVTLLYGALAAVGGVLAWGVVLEARFMLVVAPGVTAVGFAAVWWWTSQAERAAAMR